MYFNHILGCVKGLNERQRRKLLLKLSEVRPLLLVQEEHCPQDLQIVLGKLAFKLVDSLLYQLLQDLILGEVVAVVASFQLRQVQHEHAE